MVGRWQVAAPTKPFAYGMPVQVSTRRTLAGHTKRITSVAYSPDGRTLASGSPDGTVLLWAIAPTTDPLRVADVNRDGVVNIFDLVRVGSNFAQKGQNDADINRDGVVDILRFDVGCQRTLSSEAAAPSAHLAALAGLTLAEVQNWLAQAQGLDLTDVISQKGVIFLEISSCCVTTSKNDTFGQLSKSVQPRDMDAVSPCPNLRCHAYYL